MEAKLIIDIVLEVVLIIFILAMTVLFISMAIENYRDK